MATSCPKINMDFSHAYSMPGAYPNDATSPQSCSSLTAYPYQPLPAGSWIRVLRLEPGSGNDSIKAQLHTKNLYESIGHYDALSYVWGSEDSNNWIFVDNHMVAIRNNLFQFLTMLRSASDALHLWADAICINQGCVDEKSQQVAQMREVYMYSHTTRLWLGYGGLDMAMYFSSVPEFDKIFITSSGRNTLTAIPRKSVEWDPHGSTSDRTFAYIPHGDTVTFVPSEHVKGRQSGSIATGGLTWILHNSYWTRLWIVQEVVLSPGIQVHVSDVSFPWATFVRMCKQAVAQVSRESASLLAESPMLRLHNQRKQPVQRASFAEVLKIHWRSSCLDLRDRVFGLVGLAKDIAINIDYNMSRAQLFVEVMRKHPAELASDLAEILWTALDVASDVDLGSCIQLNYLVPLRVRECGLIVQQAGRPLWSESPHLRLHVHMDDDNSLEQGEPAYSFSATPKTASQNTPHFLVMLSIQHRGDGRVGRSSTTSIMPYTIVGRAYAFYKTDGLEEIVQSMDEDILSTAEAYRHRRSFGYGPMILEVSLKDFICLRLARCFEDPNHSLATDGRIDAENSGGRLLCCRDDDDDNDQADTALCINA